MQVQKLHCCYGIDLMVFFFCAPPPPSPHITAPCVPPLMSFVRHLIFKEENNCEMAQQHSNWSFYFDQYLHPPAVDRARRVMRNKFIIIIFLVYRFRSRGREATSVFFSVRKKAYLKWAAVDRTCRFDNTLSHRPHSDEMHCLINNADPHH